VQSIGADSKENQSKFSDHCRAGFNPSGLKSDAIDMASRKRTNTKVFVRDATIKWPHSSVVQPRRYKREHCSPF